MIDYDNSEIIEAILLKNEDDAKALMAYVLREAIGSGSFSEEDNDNE